MVISIFGEKIRKIFPPKFPPAVRTESVFVGPCHHVMAHPQVADGGTACDMEGSCE